MNRIRVGGTSPYDVVIGTGVLAELPGLVGAARTVAVVHVTKMHLIGKLHAGKLCADLIPGKLS